MRGSSLQLQTFVVPPICRLTLLYVCIAQSETNAQVGASFSMDSSARGFFKIA
jgi:hypothetical protein